MGATAPTPARQLSLRPLVWLLHVALPLFGLWLLLAQPELDVRYEHVQGHFWVVTAAALINVVLALRISREARRRDDARLFLLGMAFTVAAGFFTLHALATPNVLVAPNVGFNLATPVGLVVAGALGAVSAIDLSPARAAAVLRRQRWVQAGVALVLLGWAVVSLAELPPLRYVVPAEELRGPLRLAAVVGIMLYLAGALGYARIHRRRPSVVVVSIITAFVLLAEALLATAVAPNWHASWWEWHLLLILGFGFVAYSEHVQHQREGTRRGLFDSIALEQTLRSVREDYGSALEALVDGMQRRAQADDAGDDVEALVGRVAARFDLTERQARVLERAAEALAAERQQLRRLGGLVAVGQHASVVREEAELLEQAAAAVAEAFSGERVRVGLLRDGSLTFAAGDSPPGGDTLRDHALATLEPVLSSDGGTFVVPLSVKGHAAGVVQADRPLTRFAERDQALLRSLASQLSIALENARLYRQLDGLFRSYMSPDVATALVADPSQAELGGAINDVTVLMADLRGFTPFSERSSPAEVVEMLNAYWGAVVPVILAAGGTVVQFIGDAVMALFGAPVRQPDHALRAARCGLQMQQRVAEIAADHPEWPRFRVGVNSGPALVGNVGSEEFRNFTAIGDTTNLAARLEGLAPEGKVVIGPATRAALGERAVVEAMGPVTVKGKKEAVEPCILLALAPERART